MWHGSEEAATPVDSNARLRGKCAVARHALQTARLTMPVKPTGRGGMGSAGLIHAHQGLIREMKKPKRLGQGNLVHHGHHAQHCSSPVPRECILPMSQRGIIPHRLLLRQVVSTSTPDMWWLPSASRYPLAQYCICCPSEQV